MPASTLKRLLCGVAFLLPVGLLSAPQGQYPDAAKSNKTTVTVHIVWLPNFAAVNAMCGFLAQTPVERAIVGCYNPKTNTIYAVEPENFNDHFRLEILGHEFWHALGAEHPAL